MHLSRLASLLFLNLNGENITDVGIAELTRLTTLEELNLAGTRITDRGLEAMRGAMPRTKITH